MIQIIGATGISTASPERHCGVVPLTSAPQFTLRPRRRPCRLPLKEPIDQGGQIEQVRHTHDGSVASHNDLRIGRHDVGPLLRNGAHPVAIGCQQQPTAVPVRSLTDAHEFLTGEGMERMGHAHKARRDNRTGCTMR